MEAEFFFFEELLIVCFFCFALFFWCLAFRTSSAGENLP